LWRRLLRGLKALLHVVEVHGKYQSARVTLVAELGTTVSMVGKCGANLSRGHNEKRTRAFWLQAQSILNLVGVQRHKHASGWMVMSLRQTFACGILALLMDVLNRLGD
jgi:hypothetical protein